MAAIRLAGQIARLAEKADHHPDLHLTRYRRLRIVLTTHSAGKITGKDLSLALKISKLIRSKEKIRKNAEVFSHRTKSEGTQLAGRGRVT